ncbi:MAG: hypothetical protein WBO29_05040 [Albidovulum sp.]
MSTDLVVELDDKCLEEGEYLGFHCKLDRAFHSSDFPERKALRLRISRTGGYGGEQRRTIARDGHIVIDVETLLFLSALMVENGEVKIERTGASRLLCALGRAVAEGRVTEDGEMK